MNIEQFIQALEAEGIALNDNQLRQFERYYTLLVEWNEKINLTAITERHEVYLKHFYDSIMTVLHLPLNQESVTLCDVGAGAGFPSIPMKIVRPNLEVTIVDSLQKRIHFLEQLVEELELEGVHCVHGRAEEVGQNPQYREQFDFVTARAVAALNVLSEYCLPLVKPKGYFLALKSQKADQELSDAQNAITLLGGQFISQSVRILPQEEAERSFILIQKVTSTPVKYPRKAGKPAKQPIK